MFFTMADLLAAALLDCVENKLPDERIRRGLVRLVMFISDCFRYSLDYQVSTHAAQLMHILNPGDPEAHMRLGINSSMLLSLSDAIQPYYHYCVFLANRQVEVKHKESELVRNFVSTMFQPPASDSSLSEKRTRKEFFCTYIRLLWSILSDEFEEASENAKDRQVWDLFSPCLDHGLSAEDVLHIVGALLFTHYRTSPRGNRERALLRQRELSDFVICQFMCTSCEFIKKNLVSLQTTVRYRRKNRVRALQKKRKAGTVVPEEGPNIKLQCDLFKTMIDSDATAPLMGAVSFLAHYWSKARSAPAPNADLKPLFRAYRAVRGVEEEIRKLEEMTSIVPIVSHIESKIIDSDRGVIPAMPEDVKYSTLLPCKDYEMFSHASLQDVPLPSILQRSADGIVRTAVVHNENRSYESLVSSSSQRHLEAFSVQCVKEVPGVAQALDRESACAVVCWTIRKFRIRRLSTDLEKVGGGVFSRMSLQSSSESDKERRASDQYISDRLPLPAQPRSAQPETSSMHENMTPGQLGAKLRKRRRLLGDFTLPHRSHSFPSSEEHNMDRVDNVCQSTPNAAKQTVSKERGPCRSPEPYQPSYKALSRGSILSQGTLQLSFAFPPNEFSVPPKRRATVGRPDDLSSILTNILYRRELSRNAPVDLDKPAPWRIPLKLDKHKIISELVFHTPTSQSP